MGILDQLDAIQGSFLTMQQAAAIVGVDRSTVGRWCVAGKIEARHVGFRWWIPKQAVIRLMRVAPPQTAGPVPR